MTTASEVRVGDIVLCVQGTADRVNNAAVTEFAAIVTYVPAPGIVDLTLFCPPVVGYLPTMTMSKIPHESMVAEGRSFWRSR